MAVHAFKSLPSKTFCIVAITLAASVISVSATADDKAPETATTSSEVAADFQITKASDGLIRSGIKAFNKGNFEKAVSLNKAVIRIRPSRRKTAVAQANLCASLGKLGDMAQAELACEAALNLNPDLETAKSNRNLLRVHLAQK